ncbi:NADH-ubiquinone oxidoreductase 39-40 kDa subunit [Neoasaia chiangmaiensis NBRC 101099]|uniref:NADH-ubiquinone oxidoreductase n=1 Tax=Neoasaia chiangmaiensis TaxID=320497 RepID=A0A1U9KLX6_9PROT|nr:NAD(P)H-binding protein [Neoasaia chiangmaiensis]AQS86789.1 NADH-ubiquinone oxidoreductase [Neoasaia chiangmaiensis]GBR35439.1 NADH-ubiquinone oxidoreductase 39-40 kDa subunit [Neoasaia chiangmaiensis NBRC 101099]GEN16350.1 hypothetical protein NCH01_27810 [Neoasaia chiangmaiensis]
MNDRIIHVIGASGRSGRSLCRALHARGYRVVPIVRDPARLPPDDRYAADARVADVSGPAKVLVRALSDARHIVNTAHARHTGAILNAAPPHATLIGLGSTRKFTRWPDAHGTGVLAGEQALMTSRRPGIMLHPTMIYGATGEDNVQRLARLLKFLPIVPLPQGGTALVQPIHQDDVTAALIAAIDRATSGKLDAPGSMVIAGPQAMAYRDFVQGVAKAAGLGKRPILSLPAAALMAITPLAARLPGLPRIGRDEIRRLMEDKAFDITPMRTVLGVDPRPLKDGLTQLFARD